MFEKYNEKARRALFFARYEASKLGSRVIESEHILLGVLREGEEIIKEIFSRFNVKPEQIRREVEGDRLFVDRISSSAELPLSEESKKILAYAAHEAESMLHQYVGTEHLLIGILRVESSTAARILTAKGLNVYGVREETISILKEREADKQKKELSRSSPAAPRTTRSSSASLAWARPPSSRVWHSASSTATCLSSSPTSASSRSTSPSSWPARSTAASSKSG